MVKPEWGTKRTCPECSTRFYDLGQDEPVECINEECGHKWIPEPVLKSKQPLPFEAEDDKKKKDGEDDDDLAIDEDEEPSADDDVDLDTGDDDIVGKKSVKSSDDAGDDD